MLLGCFLTIRYSLFAIRLLKLFHPRPHLDFPRPGAARLVDEVQERGGDRVGIEQARGLVRGLSPPLAPDAAVDHDMPDVDALRLQLARHALREPAQRELAHGEG